MEFQPDVAESIRGFRERDAEQNRLDYLRDEYYKVEKTAESGQLAGTASLSSVNNNPAILLPNGADDAGRWNIVKPELWRNGELRVVVYWTTDGTSTSDVDWSITVRDIGAVDAVLSNTSLLADTSSVAGSGSANTLYETTFTTMSNDVTDDHKVITLVVQRLGSSDANNDDVYIFGAYVEFLPNNRQ